MAVTLRPRRRLNVHYLFDLIINGTGPHAIADASGRTLDETASDLSGSNESISVGPANLVIHGRHLKDPSKLLGAPE